MTGLGSTAIGLGRTAAAGGLDLEQETSPVDMLATRLARSELLGQVPGVAHGVTGRVPNLGAAEGNVGYSPPRDAADAWRMRRRWCEAAGMNADLLATVGQVHGVEVLQASGRDAGRGARPDSGRVGLGDTLITDQPGVVLMTLHADCLPVLLVDPDRPAVAAVHAGWRGTVAGIVGRTVRAMTDAFGSHPGRLVAFMGPGIGPCCYEVGPEVVGAWMERGVVDGTDARWAIRATPTGATFDLKRANTLLLREAGVVEEHIDVHPDCTRCQGNHWFSHRGQGAGTGRFGAMISITASGTSRGIS